MAFEEMKFNLLIKRLSKLKDGEIIKLDLEPWEISILFDSNNCLRQEIMKHRKKIDWNGISLNSLNITNMDFTGMKGVKFKEGFYLYSEPIKKAKFTDVEFIQPIKNSCSDCDFTGSIGAKMCPRIMFGRNISGTKCCDVEFFGKSPFEDVLIENTDFTGSVNAVFNPNTVKNASLQGAVLTDVKLTDMPMSNVNVTNTNFEGSNIEELIKLNTEFTSAIIKLSKGEDISQIFDDVDYLPLYKRILSTELSLTSHPIKLPLSEDIKRKLLFYEKENSKLVPNDFFKEFQEKIDFSNISFDNVSVRCLDLSKLKGAKINPQTVWDKNLEGTKCNGHDFTGCSFDDVLVMYTDFTGATAVKINPQTLRSKALVGSICNGLDFTDCSFDGVAIRDANFRGSRGVKINPQKVYNKNLVGTVLSGVELTDTLDNTSIRKTIFEGVINAVVNPQTIENLWDTKCKDLKFNGPLTGVDINDNTDFEGSNYDEIIALERRLRNDIRLIRSGSQNFNIYNDSTMIPLYQKVLSDSIYFYDFIKLPFPDDILKQILFEEKDGVFSFCKLPRSNFDMQTLIGKIDISGTALEPLVKMVTLEEITEIPIKKLGRYSIKNNIYN